MTKNIHTLKTKNPKNKKLDRHKSQIMIELIYKRMAGHIRPYFIGPRDG
jgi:hypothetical protein